MLGANGLPTVIQSTFVLPQPSGFSTDSAAGISIPFPGQGTQGSSSTYGTYPGNAGSTTCETYTYLGSDGKPTVVESTYTIPWPIQTVTGAPYPATNTEVGSGTGIPITPGQLSSATCVTYTYLGADGRPTVVETSWFASGPANTAGDIPIPTPTYAQTPGDQSLPPNDSGASGPITTSVIVTIIGDNGIPTVLETTYVVTASAATGFPLSSPNAFPSGSPTTSLVSPEGYTQNDGSKILTEGSLTYSTATVIGPDGVLTPVLVSGTISGPLGAQFTTLAAPIPGPGSSEEGGLTNSQTGLSGYGNMLTSSAVLPPSLQPFPPVITEASTVAGVSGSGMVTQLGTSTFTILVSPGGTGLPSGVGLPPSYDDSNDKGVPNGDESEITLWPTASSSRGGPAAYGGLGMTPSNLPAISTSTWMNVIPEETTTYTLNFPLTTLITAGSQSIPLPFKRGFRRQIW